jgi:hypothetical protein
MDLATEERRHDPKMDEMNGGEARVEVLKELAARRYDDFVEALEEAVNIDSGSYTPEGVNRVADLCEAGSGRTAGPSNGSRTSRRKSEPPLGDLRSDGSTAWAGRACS